jgi:hypothetical protein
MLMKIIVSADGVPPKKVHWGAGKSRSRNKLAQNEIPGRNYDNLGE